MVKGPWAGPAHTAGLRLCPKPQMRANTMDMTGKTVMITGASRGIGAAAAKVFADAGANVALLARGQSAIADLAGDIGASALAIPCNVARYSDVHTAVE